MSQSDQTVIWCPNGIRKIDPAYRIQDTPEKMNLAELNSTIKDDSLKKKPSDSKLLISFPNTNSLYEGYANLIQIGFKSKKMKRFHLECDGCDTIFPKTKHHATDWIIKVSRTDKVTIRAIGKNGNVLTQSSFPVFPIPAPIIYFDDCKAQEILK